MLSHRSLLSQSIRKLGGILLVLSAPSILHAQSATAPTVSEDPVSIDQIWQKASSKYDTERATLLKDVDTLGNQGPFRPDWESLEKYEVPEWYKDAKFGIFIHWGVYSVPAFGNEWHPRNMYKVGSEEYKHHIATYGPPDKFGYKDFIPMFKAEHFDPAAWAELFKKAGAKYVVPVAEHHDGCYYEGLIPANRLELMDPVFNMFSGHFDNYAEAAAKQWGSKGVWFPETTWFDGLEKLPNDVLSEMQELFLMKKPWDQRSEKFRRYEQVKQTYNSRWNFINHEGKWELGLWTRGDKGRGPFGHTTHILSSTAKISCLYWLRYDVSRDEAFLRDYAYPMLKGTVEFYRNSPNLKKEGDGKYHIYHVNNHEGIWDGQDTQEELSAIRGITPLAIRASEILGVDADLRPLWQELLQNLAPLPTNETTHTRKPGEPIVWVGSATLERPQGWPALLPTAYYDLCTVATEDPDMAAVGKASYDAAMARGVNEKTPCRVLSRDAVSAAKSGRAEHVKYLVPNQLRRLAAQYDDADWAGVGKIAVLRNRFSLNEGPGCMAFEEGGLAAQALHTALLMDSPPAPGKDSVIQVFAAWPKEWDAEFTLAARGAFLVTSAFRNGNVQFIELRSRAGGECRLRNPWVDGDITLFRNGKQAEEVGGRLLKFNTAKDEVLLVLKKGVAPSKLNRTVVA
jgi:hypothetical protein